MATIDEVVEGVRGGRLVAALFDLPETDVIDDEQGGGCPGLEPACVRAIGESCMEVVEQIDAAGVAHADPLLARAEAERLEDVTLAGAGLARDDEIVASSNEVESGELEDQRFVELGLEIPIEGFERLSFHEATDMDASRDALLEFARGLEAEDALEQGRGAGALAGRPGESLVELGECERQSEERAEPAAGPRPRSSRAVAPGRSRVAQASRSSSSASVSVSPRNSRCRRNRSRTRASSAVRPSAS